MDIEIRAAKCGSNFCAKIQKQKQNNLLEDINFREVV